MESLVPSISLDALLLKRDAMVERLRVAHRQFQELEVLGNALLGTLKHDTPRFNALALAERRVDEHFTRAEALPRFIRDVDAQVWDHLLTESGLWTFMDNEARGRWREQISKGEVPELTRANVEATFQALHGSRGEMLERGVLSLFRALSWDYKTNTPHKLGKRVVLTRAAYFWDRTHRHGGVEHGAANKLDDLVRVFLVLDSKPEPDHRQGAYHALTNAQWPVVTRDVALQGVVSVRGFLNGNAHVTFLRPDLVDQVNRILARHHPNALPPKRE